MSEKTKITSGEGEGGEPRNAFSLFPKLKLEWPFLKQPEARSVAEEGERRREAVVGLGDDASSEAESPKPAMVRFPKAQVAVPPPVAVENQESGKTSNPIILWQVYALGGFLVLRWIWARWNERKGRKEDPPADDDEHNSAE